MSSLRSAFRTSRPAIRKRNLYLLCWFLVTLTFIAVPVAVGGFWLNPSKLPIAIRLLGPTEVHEIGPYLDAVVSLFFWILLWLVCLVGMFVSASTLGRVGTALWFVPGATDRIYLHVHPSVYPRLFHLARYSRADILRVAAELQNSLLALYQMQMRGDLDPTARVRMRSHLCAPKRMKALGFKRIAFCPPCGIVYWLAWRYLTRFAMLLLLRRRPRGAGGWRRWAALWEAQLANIRAQTHETDSSDIKQNGCRSVGGVGSKQVADEGDGGDLDRRNCAEHPERNHRILH